MMNLTGRIALVTGGSRGIGAATCVMLGSLGAHVLVHYRSHGGDADALVAQISASGGTAAAIPADLSQPGGAESLIAQALEHAGHIDILVNNAGEYTDSPLIDMSDETWQHTLDLNLTAVFRCIRGALPSMRAQSWGRIINVSSQAAWAGSINHAHYAASKAGLQGLTYSLAKEEGRHGITVNIVSPGRIVTDMLADHIPSREQEWRAQTPLRRLGQPEEVAGAIAFLASDLSSYMTGTTLHVNGGVLMS